MLPVGGPGDVEGGLGGPEDPSSAAACESKSPAGSAEGTGIRRGAG